MLEVLINYICSFFIALLGYYIIKKLTSMDTKLTRKNIIILLLNALFVAIIQELNSSCIFSYVVNVITYRMIFRVRIEESLVATGILMLLIVAADISFVPLLSIFSSLKSMENNQLIFLISNIGVMIIAYIYFRIKFIFKLLKKSYDVLLKNDLYVNIIFLVIILITVTIVIYNMYLNNYDGVRIINDILIVIVMVFIAAIFIKRQDNYNALSDQYNSLFDYVQNFEDWIEKEQFTRHEYKNQLAVIYALSNEKDVKNKVNEILNNSINIADEQIHQLKVLPKGGLKGLMYYKTTIAKKDKINVTIDISIKNNGILQKLSKKRINELTKILGIYYDNAIEAARDSRKKIILIEIYEIKDKVSIVISNTFKKSSIVKEMANKGVSSKGKGRGNGLYYANKIVNNNDWIITKQEIIDNYYIETITILKNTSKN